MQLIFSPQWFSLADICISTVSALVAFLLAIYIFKIHTFSKDLKHKYLSAAFLAICAAFIISAATRLFATYNLFARHASGIAFYSFNVLRSPSTFYAIGELAFRFLILAGLLTILHVIEQNENKKLFDLLLFFGALVTLFSIAHYYVFYIATFAVGVLITYHFLRNYFRRPNGKTAAMLAGFFIITISQALLIMAALESIYAQASLIQLLGFSLLLATYLQLRK